jgi:3-phosphoshikimate 1-carboxyvinyltransferase
MTFLDLPAAHRATGSVRLPGSKSISNRLLLLAAMARGTTELVGLLDADDTRVMARALEALGIVVDAARVQGAAGVFPVKQADLFLGNAGTAIRPLTAALALSSGDYRVDGVARMRQRPIGDLVDALRGLGAAIDYELDDGFPPLRIHPGRLQDGQPVRVRGDVSSQFLTALLLTLPLTGRVSRIEVEGDLISKPYVEITLNLMARFGIVVEREAWSSFMVPPGPYVSPGRIHVEGDASAASYFLAAGAIAGGPVRVEGVGRHSVQGDVRFTEVLECMGARVVVGDGWISAERAGPLKALDMDLNHIPDAAMTAAVLALFAPGTSVLRNIASWRVKETDRLAAMATELRKLGADVEEGSDYLRITPGALNPGVAIDTYDDHRMAMSFSLVSLGGVPVRINDPGCVAKTFPDYFDAFRSIVERVAPR